mgnify:CR=1 FL=1
MILPFFISKNILLTSAHNVTKLLFHSLNRITIFPARIRDKKEFDSLRFKVNYELNIRYPEEYSYRRNNTHNGNDWALIYINDAVINSLPRQKEIEYLKLLEDESFKVGDTLYCAGYPAFKEYQNQYVMTMDTSIVTRINTDYFEHSLKTVPGNSGSPIMVKRGNEFYVVGVNSIIYKGTWLNTDKQRKIKEWIKNLEEINK